MAELLPALGVLAVVLACETGPSTDDPDPPRGGAVIALAGDTMLGRGIDAQLAADPSFAIFRELEPHMHDVDLLALNLETTITDAVEQWPGKNYHFKLHPDRAAAALDQLPVPPGTPRVVSLANNHVLDFHVPGLLDTMASLDALGVIRVGAGADDHEARAPAIITTADDVRVGVLAVSSHCSCGTDAWRAGPAAPGMWQIDTAPGDDWDELLTAVSELRREVDWVVVSLHWGPNWVDGWPIDWMRDLGEQLTDAGASVVFGHSAHHVLPVSERDGAVVLYGTGDLIDDYGAVEGFRADLGMLAKIRLDPDTGAALEIVPLRIEHHPHFVHPIAPSDSDHARVLQAARAPTPSE